MRAFLLIALLAAPLFAGCLQDDTIRFAFVTKDTALEPSEDPERLAAFLEEQTGRPVEVVTVTSSSLALEALRVGQADFASVDGAAGWLSWQRLGLEAVASEVRGDGRTHYVAAAWVRADSDIQTVADLEGRTSCHTGATKSAGMMMPISYLIANGYIDATGYSEVSQLPEMAASFFDEPIIGGAYEGYDGAFKCLSEGVGEVAFVRDTTADDYCGAEALDWCLARDNYRMLVEFGPVPEHPIMVSPETRSQTVTLIVDALLALNDSDEGRDILASVFGTHGIQAVETEAHLGGYGELIAYIPGIEAYAESK